MDKRKKVQVWLSPMEFQTLSDYCERNGVSFYSVLKEGINRIVLGEVDQEEPPIALKQGIDMVAPSVKAVQVANPELEDVQRGLYNLAKEVDKLKGNEDLWKEMGNLKERVTRLEGINTKELKKIAVDAAVGAVEELGLTRGERV